jgi:uncharacterized protein YdcH (DUF465 family)
LPVETWLAWRSGLRSGATGLTSEELRQKWSYLRHVNQQQRSESVRAVVRVTGLFHRLVDSSWENFVDHSITALEVAAEVCDGRMVSHLCKQALALNEDSSG